MNTYLKYFIVVAISMGTGFVGGQLTVKRIHSGGKKEMPIDSTIKTNEKDVDYEAPINPKRPNSKKELFYYETVARFFGDSTFQLSHIKFPSKRVRQ
jgi:hypothetical protein